MPGTLTLRKTSLEDLPTLFEFQSDPEAVVMAAFTVADPADREAYMSKWTALLDKDGVTLRTVLKGEVIVGQVLSYDMEGEAQISYGIDKAHWGKGYATEAVNLFLTEFKPRPIWGRVAFDNDPSKRVLEKCGFLYHATEQFHANARGKEIDEWIYIIEK